MGKRISSTKIKITLGAPGRARLEETPRLSALAFADCAVASPAAATAPAAAVVLPINSRRDNVDIVETYRNFHEDRLVIYFAT